MYTNQNVGIPASQIARTQGKLRAPKKTTLHGIPIRIPPVDTTTLTFQSTVAVLVKTTPLGCKICVLVSNDSDNTTELNCLPYV